jgi:hypothetical protein
VKNAVIFVELVASLVSVVLSSFAGGQEYRARKSLYAVASDLADRRATKAGGGLMDAGEQQSLDLGDAARGLAELAKALKVLPPSVQYLFLALLLLLAGTATLAIS